jgi:hypothetical protein
MYALGFRVPVEQFFPPFVVWVALRLPMSFRTFHQWPYLVLAAVNLDNCLLFVIQYLRIGMLEAVSMARCLALFFFAHVMFIARSTFSTTISMWDLLCGRTS